jgi:hypothetical protein
MPRAHTRNHLRSVRPSRCSRAPSPRAWARLKRSGRALRLVLNAPSPPSTGRRVRLPQLPSIGSRIVDFSSSWYRVIQVDAHAPFDKGWLVLRRFIHESTYAGLLGGARSRSLGTEARKLSLNGIPPTSCPRWLLNTTCGAPSSSLTLSIWGACSNPSRVRLRTPDQ